MTLLDEKERASLREADVEFEKFQRVLESAVENDVVDGELLDRLDRTAKDAVRRFRSNLPPEIDPVVAAEINDRLVAILTPEIDEDRLLDAADAVIVEAEAVRHIVRDLLQEQPPADSRDTAECLRLLDQWLPTLPPADLASLLDISVRHLQRLRNQSRKSSHRMQLVVRLVAILRHAWTDQGVYGWFLRQRPDLDGAVPIDLLDDVENEGALMRAARAGRVQGAA